MPRCSPELTHSKRGSLARQVGAVAEQLVAQAVQRWEQAGLCALTPGHPGMRYVGKLRGRPVFEPKGQGTVDWTGSVGGVAVAFDVKATQDARWKRNPRSLPEHEARFLSLFERSGGVACLLVCINALTAPRFSVWLSGGRVVHQLERLDEFPGLVRCLRAATPADKLSLVPAQRMGGGTHGSGNATGPGGVVARRAEFSQRRAGDSQ